MRFGYLLAAFAAITMSAAVGLAQELTVPNASFEDGDAQNIAHWTMENGPGHPTTDQVWDGARAAEVQGDPDATSYWRSEPLDFRPRALYAMYFEAKRAGEGGGPPVAGPAFSNYIMYGTDLSHWQDYTVIFQTPDDITPDRAWLRLGQARMLKSSTVTFDAVRIFPIQPVYARSGDIELGDGESIEGNRYIASPTWAVSRSNQFRPLYGFKKTVYNQNAFLMGDGSEVVFRYQVGSRAQRSAKVSVKPMYYFNGALVVEASTDGETWQELHRFAARKGATLDLPASFFPAEVIWVRMRCEAEEPVGVDFQLGALGLSTFGYEAQLDGPPVKLLGATRFVEILGKEDSAPVTVVSTGDLVPYGDNTYLLDANNPADKPMPVKLHVVVEHEGNVTHDMHYAAELKPAATTRLAVPYEMETYGKYSVTVSFEEGLDYACRSVTYASPLYASGYGEQLPGTSDAVKLWWASSGWRVARTIPAPTAQGDAVRIRLARNEAEAAQIVIRPAKKLTGFSATSGDLHGPGGSVIPAAAVEVLRVRYVDVAMPTDRLGAIAEWPEPLPPFRGPIELDAGQNQPLWVRVTTPKDIPAGTYAGEVHLTADGYDATVPLHVDVYDFALPKEMTLETAFGASESMIAQYHHLKNLQQRRQVWEKYLAALAAYHLSPYDPAPFEDITVEWPKAGADPATMTAKIDYAAWADEMERVLDKYRFKTFRLRMPGLSGSKYPNHKREIAGFQGDTPEFKALFDSYASQIESLLREKGWLDKAFVYWFDEPYDNDIAFVQSGFQLLIDAAPDLRRMIAVNSMQYLPRLEGYINVWCPQINAVSMPFLEQREQAGDRFWWYVCTNPKEPYPGIFIDHPAVDLRVWSWMTWGYHVEGLLVWSTTRWHSGAAHPHALQNPYEDPMTWQGDAGEGVRNPYGNGDGVLLYPPESAFDSGNQPVLDAPVGSQRGEMLRDGIEDYEYFVILRRLLQEKGDRLSEKERATCEALLTPPARVYTDRRNYSFDPAAMEQHRDKLARAIVMLQGR